MAKATPKPSKPATTKTEAKKGDKKGGKKGSKKGC